MKERNKFPQDKKSEHVKCRKTSIIILSSTRKNHLDKAKSMLSGIPALHSSFIQQSTKFSAYIIVIGNKILNKEPYIIIIANSVQSTWVKHNPHLVFQKTTDKMCSLWFFLAQYRADKTLWSLTPKLPKCRGWCAVKAVHRIAMSIFPADFWAQPPATSARWRWQCPSDTGAAVSHWLPLPGTRHGCWMGQRAFFGFCSVLRLQAAFFFWHQKW